MPVKHHHRFFVPSVLCSGHPRASALSRARPIHERTPDSFPSRDNAGVRRLPELAQPLLGIIPMQHEAFALAFRSQLAYQEGTAGVKMPLYGP